eukprot:3250088-Prymnesium_polylepis.1
MTSVFRDRVCAAVAPSQLEWVDPASEQPAEGVVRLVVDEAIEALLPLSEMVDAAKERARLGKQKAKLEADIEKISNRLNAPGFADKVGRRAPRERAAGRLWRPRVRVHACGELRPHA